MLLNCHSYYSLRYGIIGPKEMVEWMGQICAGFQAEGPDHYGGRICLTDINNVSGVLDLFRLGKKAGIRPCAGVDFRNGADQLYVAIARNSEGFCEINRFLSHHLMEKLPFEPIAPQFENAYVIYPFEKANAADFTQKLRPHEYIGVKPHELGKLRFSRWKRSASRLLALATATFRNATDHNTHKLLRSMANNCLLSKLPPEECGNPADLYRSPEEIAELYADAPGLIRNAEKLLESCALDFDFTTHKNKQVFGTDAEADFRQMTELAFEGLRYRYPRYNYKVKQRLEKEMVMIHELGFTAYFLMSWDIVRFAQSRNFYYVGRGSGANSMVAYCLRITDVDPIDLDLYFERFINPFRSSPPDFDLDFSWQDRDEVTAYILNKYGYEHAALLGTYNTFQANAVVRELGKVFGLPKAEIDALLDKPSHFSPRNVETAHAQRVDPSKGMEDKNVYANPGIIERNSLYPIQDEAGRSAAVTDALSRKILSYAHRIHDMPNYRSVHAGGILISELPIFHYSATDLPPKGFPVVQFSMLEAEDIGLAKLDILSQRGLGHIKDAIGLIKQNRGMEVDIHDIPAFKNDERIRKLIRSGHTMGCFYVESPAMRQLLKKLKCEDYLTLVAASSVIRPGVARSGMMREYIMRHIDPEARKRAHPVMQAIVPDTYGIMVYQEDVIKVANEFAGLGLAESDVLRRGMSGKFRSREEFQRVQDRFMELAREKGHARELIGEVWHQIESFAGYSFAKGHSASYAVESYQSLYLKAWYPLEFYVAVINNFGGFYRTEFYVHGLRMSGANVLAPCVNNSDYLTNIRGKDVHLGLVHVGELEQKVAQRIMQDRAARGPYADLFNLTERSGISLEQLKILIRIGALRFTGKNKKELMWEAHWILNKKKPMPENLKLFSEKPKEFRLPSLDYDKVEDAFEQIDLLGFPLCDPFELVQRAPGESVPRGMTKRGPFILAEGYLVTVKPTRTVKGEEMNFGTWIDAKGYFFDTVHFPPSLRAWPFKGRGVYRLWGALTEEFGVISIEVQKMEKLPYKVDPRWE